MNKGNQQQINKIINDLTQKINGENTPPPSTRQVDELLQGLNKAQAEKVRSILNDPEATKKILDTPQARELMKKLGEKK